MQPVQHLCMTVFKSLFCYYIQWPMFVNFMNTVPCMNCERNARMYAFTFSTEPTHTLMHFMTANQTNIHLVLAASC